MKSIAILLSMSLLISAHAMAAQSNLELAGDCKPAVEKALSFVSGRVIHVLGVADYSADEFQISYEMGGIRMARPEIVTLQETKEVVQGNKTYVIQCKVLIRH